MIVYLCPVCSEPLPAPYKPSDFSRHEVTECRNPECPFKYFTLEVSVISHMSAQQALDYINQ